MSPTWPITGMSAARIASTAGRMRLPPSTLTAAAPASARKRPAFSTARPGSTWYERNGMSPTTTARLQARATARVWRTIVSIVAESVFGSPYTVISTESPASRMSMPASSSRRAEGAS